MDLLSNRNNLSTNYGTLAGQRWVGTKTMYAQIESMFKAIKIRVFYGGNGPVTVLWGSIIIRNYVHI